MNIQLSEIINNMEDYLDLVGNSCSYNRRTIH